MSMDFSSNDPGGQGSCINLFMPSSATIIASKLAQSYLSYLYEAPKECAGHVASRAASWLASVDPTSLRVSIHLLLCCQGKCTVETKTFGNRNVRATNQDIGICHCGFGIGSNWNENSIQVFHGMW